MTSKTLMLGKRNQLTLPRDFIPRGTTLFHAEKKANGSILLEPQTTIPASQAYFWTKRWQEGERQADADIEAGRLKRYNSIDEMFKEWDQRRSKSKRKYK